MKKFIVNSNSYRFFKLFLDSVGWCEKAFSAPSPHFIKQACLIRNGIPNATWVETGTYMGQTTQVLSKIGSRVYSIEPEPKLFSDAKKYFSKINNVEIINGTSELIFPLLLPNINGDINFWLDGHYSSGVTFKGDKDTPILEELDNISRNLNRFSKVCVLVDDIRCFNPKLIGFEAYPSVDVLVDWARENKFSWHIEHDIFVAKNY